MKIMEKRQTTLYNISPKGLVFETAEINKLVQTNILIFLSQRTMVVY